MVTSKKKTAVAILSLILILAMAMTSFAASGTWKQNSKGWWYSYSDGSYAANKWENINGKWYHFSSGGYMQTGWQKINNKWYYFGTNGAMVTGWKQISNKWYYFGTNGTMYTGWKKAGSNWYYLGTKGTIVTGWQKINNQWYYFNTDGTMKTGWQKSGGKWYYLKSNGVMAINETVDGYTFDKNGVWVEKSSAGKSQFTMTSGKFKGATVIAENSTGEKFSNITVSEDEMTIDGSTHKMLAIDAVFENNTTIERTMCAGFRSFAFEQDFIESQSAALSKIWKEQYSYLDYSITDRFSVGTEMPENLYATGKYYALFLHMDRDFNVLSYTVITIIF